MADPVVTLPDGPIKGRWRSATNGEKFLSFEGVPYGETPVGKLRFKNPIPPKPWKDVKDCTKLGPGCLCYQSKNTQDPSGTVLQEYVLEGSEDCLNLNVYTKQLKGSSTSPKPVMVFIHGGAYVFGSTKYYGPERFLTEDIVLVTIHYRLGVFGFLCLDDPELEVTGNAAMKDQILALKWVQKNIALFNGDPKNVTLFGHSAGGASVAYLQLSPAAAGLFQRAIVQSCCALTNGLRGTRKNARPLAEALSCKATDEKEILKFLQEVPAEKLYEGQLKFKDVWTPPNFRMFSPVVEPKNSKDPFLTEEPVELLKTGRYNHVPTIISYAEMECLLFMNFDEKCPFNAVCYEEDTLPIAWFGFEKESKEFKDIAKKIRKFYYGDSTPEYYSLETVNMFSDNGITRGMIKTTQYLAETNKEPTYLCVFSIPSDHGENFSKKNITGATHCIELPYLFKMGEEKVNETFEAMAQKILKLWTNFAKFGKPTPQKDAMIPLIWEPVSKGHLKYLDIGEDLKLKENPIPDRMAFWDQLFQAYPQTKDY